MSRVGSLSTDLWQSLMWPVQLYPHEKEKVELFSRKKSRGKGELKTEKHPHLIA